MTQPETDSSLRVKIGYLETRNAYEHHDLTSQVEVLQKQVEKLEAELAAALMTIYNLMTLKRSETTDASSDYGPFDYSNPLDYTILRDYYVERNGYADDTA